MANAVTAAGSGASKSSESTSIQVAQPRGEPALTGLARSRKGAVALPADAPFLLESSLIQFHQPHVLAGRKQLADRGVVGMVNVDLGSPGDVQSRGLGAQGVVLVLEHPNLVPLVQRAEALVCIAAKCHAEHHRHANR